MDILSATILECLNTTLSEFIQSYKPHPQEVNYLAGKEAPSSVLINYLWRCNYSEYGSTVKGIGNSIKLNQHLLYHACLGISHLKGVKQSKGQEESQEEKKLEARKGEYNTPVGCCSKVLEDP